MASSGRVTRNKKRKATDSSSEKSEDITDKYINDILKNKHMLEDMCGQSFSTDVSSRGTQYEKITKQIEEYTWVQCDNVDCQKWRQIPNSVAEQLNDDTQWYCYMNSDKQYNTCAKPEEDYTAYDKLAKRLGYKYVMSQLTEGALVWAKMHGYCRWPGIVTKDPITEYMIDIDFDGHPTHYHVEYLGKNHSHAWIAAANVTLYGHKEDDHKSPEKSSSKEPLKRGRGRKKSLTSQTVTSYRKRYRQSLVDDAIQEAETLMDLSVEERLKQMKFHVKPKKPLEVQIKKEPVDENDVRGSNMDSKPVLRLTKTPETYKIKKKVSHVSRKKPGPKSKVKLINDTVYKSGSVSIPVVTTYLPTSQAKQSKDVLHQNRNKNAGQQLKKGANSTIGFSSQLVVKSETCLLLEGTLVLAKLEGYDKWPAIITKDPHTGIQYEMNYNNNITAYHVEFLGPTHSHAWIKADKICLYDKENIDAVSQSSEKSQKKRSKKTLTSPKSSQSKSKKLKLEKSKDEAELLMSLSLQKRLQQCKYRYNSDGQETDDFQYRDSGFESWNHPASSVCSAASSAEQFACEKLNYNSTLVDKSKEERFKIDVEMYKKNEKAFIHDLTRFMKRHNITVNLTAHWHHVPVGAFQLFLAVHERGGFDEVCRKKQWTAVYRELTETQFSAGPAPKNFYLRNIYPYELYVTGGDYESEIQKLQAKSRKKSVGEVMIQDEAGSFTNVDDESDDLTAILEDLEEYSSLCQLEEDIEAEKKRMGINIAYHEDSCYTKTSPGVKYHSTPSEFKSPRSQGRGRRNQAVPETMFSVSSEDSQNELIYHQMQRIVDNELL